MALALDTIVKGAIGFKDVMDAFAKGCYKACPAAFKERIHHILEANGAFYNGIKGKGHAQKNQNISFNIIQPYPEGELKGLFPTIIIQP